MIWWVLTKISQRAAMGCLARNRAIKLNNINIINLHIVAKLTIYGTYSSMVKKMLPSSFRILFRFENPLISVLFQEKIKETVEMWNISLFPNNSEIG